MTPVLSRGVFDDPFLVVTVAETSKWDKLFKSGLGKFCGRQPLKNFKEYGLRNQMLFWQKILHVAIYFVYERKLKFFPKGKK